MKKFVCYSFTTIALVTFSMGASADDLSIRLAHDQNGDPFDNPSQACSQVFKNIVEADTNGDISVEISPNSQIGNATEQVQMVRDGVIQATLASTGALASYYPRIDVLNLPFAFDNIATTYQVFDGSFGKALKSDIENTLGDVVVLGFPDTGGFIQVTNSVRAIHSIEDFKDIRIRTMTLPSHQAIMNSLGAESYPLAWGEVYSALQTGVIDGQMNPLPTISSSNFGEVQDYLTLTNHLFSPKILLMSKITWEELDQQQQDILSYAVHSCVTASRGLARIIEASDRGLKGLQENMDVTAITGEERQEMEKVTQQEFESYINNNLDEEAVELLRLFNEQIKVENSNQYLFN